MKNAAIVLAMVTLASGAAQAVITKLQFQFGASAGAYTGNQSPGYANGDFLATDTYWNPINGVADATNNPAGGFLMANGTTHATGAVMRGASDPYHLGTGIGWTYDLRYAGTYHNTSVPSFYQTALMESVLGFNPDTGFAVQGLPVGAYNVYAFGVTPTAPSRQRQIYITVTPDPLPLTAVPTPSSYFTESATGSETSWIAGTNYVESTVTISSASDWLTVYSYSPTGDSSFNGIQIIWVPEPAAISLLALGGLALIRRQR